MPKASTPAHAPEQGRRHTRKPPWKSPVWCVWLVVAMMLSCWLTLNMPGSGHTRKARPVPSLAQGTKPPEHVSHRDKALIPDTDQKAGADTLHLTPKVWQHRTGQDPRNAAQNAAPNVQNALDRLAHRAFLFARLFCFVGLGALLGSLIEGRRWYRFLASSLGRLTSMARLPHIVGLALPTALVSCPAADSMLVASHARGEIGRGALIAGGMINSYLAHVSHSMRVLYPVVAAIGLPGLLYFGIQFAGGALIIACVLVWNRLHSPVPEDHANALPAAQALQPVLPWRTCLATGLVRAGSLLFRLACVSVPLILAMEWLLRSGSLDFWDQLVPATVSRFVPEELLTIMAAQLGGLIQSATVSASLAAQGLITGPQILLAMLISSAVGNPVRTLRRNLPTALGIFPMPLACIIVLGMQFSRLLVTICAAALLIVWMQVQEGLF